MGGLALFDIAFSLAYIFMARPDRQTRSARLPLFPASASRADLFLVLGEQHHHASPLPASQPQWLVISERGLYTGMLIVGEWTQAKHRRECTPIRTDADVRRERRG